MCRFFALFLVGGGITLLPAAAQAATLFARYFPLTGEIRFENPSNAPVPLVFYSIKSTAGGLHSLPTRWVSITDHYDAPIVPSPGNGLVDPNGSWIKISSSSFELAEGALDVDGGRIPAFRSVSLGRVWNLAFPFNSQTVQFAATEPNGQSILVLPNDSVDGDYNRNGVVDAADYVLWRKFFGSSGTAEALQADGNLNGLVDAGDYTIWRNNFGRSILGSGNSAALAYDSAASASLTVASVPEPMGAALLAVAAGLLCAVGVGLRRRRN